MSKRISCTFCTRILPVLAALGVGAPATAAVISPDGTLYTSVSANSVIHAAWAADNIFDQDVTGVALGTDLDPGSSDAGIAWATANVTPGWLAFELDQAYQIDKLRFQQRAFNDDPNYKVGLIQVWSSLTTPFTASDPGGASQATAVPSLLVSANWQEVDWSNSFAGRYFVMRFDLGPGPTDTPAIGGVELRLVGSPVPEPGTFALLLTTACGCLSMRRRRC